MKDEFIVRFVLRKGEGEAPKSHEIFENESLHDISKFTVIPQRGRNDGQASIFQGWG